MSRVLVVEDESAIAELISINLRHAGFEVTIAGSATQAQYEVDRAFETRTRCCSSAPGPPARRR